jgi:hypothetical protein
MANDPPFATLNHVAGDLGIPSESALLRIGIRGERLWAANSICCQLQNIRRRSLLSDLLDPNFPPMGLM